MKNYIKIFFICFFNLLASISTCFAEDSIQSVYYGRWFSSIFFANNDIGYAVGGDDHGKIIKTINGGDKWVEVKAKPNSLYLSVYFTDSLNGFICGTRGNIEHTMDGGQTWDSLRTNTYTSLYSIFMLNKEIIFAAGDTGKIIRSMDGGKTWNHMSTGIKNNLRSISFVNLQTGFAVGEGGILMRTNDCGETWTIIKKSSEQYFNTLQSLCFLDSVTGFIVGDRGIILKTVDQGFTWKKVDPQNSSYNLYSIDFNGDNGLAVGWGSGGNRPGKAVILQSQDKGETWTQINASSSNQYYSVKMVNSSTAYISDFWNILKIKIDSSESNNSYLNFQSDSPDVTYIKNSSIAAINVYPNPFTDKILVDFSAEQSSVKYTIRDSFGQILFSDNKNINGNFIEEINLSAFANGVYYVNVLCQDEVSTFRIIKGSK